MQYIKLRFEHVIIISHLVELKNQPGHSINIIRKNIGQKNEHSYVNNVGNNSDKNNNSKIQEIEV